MGTPELMTLRDFLEIYRVSKTTFYKEVAARRLRMLKVGRATKIARVDAEDWLARLCETHAANLRQAPPKKAK